MLAAIKRKDIEIHRALDRGDKNLPSVSDRVDGFFGTSAASTIKEAAWVPSRRMANRSRCPVPVSADFPDFPIRRIFMGI